MKTPQLNMILHAVEALTFANPFGKRRIELEKNLLAELGDFSSASPTATAPGAYEQFHARFRRILPWIHAAEHTLIGRASKRPLPEKWREPCACFAFFVLYHELIPDLDRIIEQGANDAAKNRALFGKVKEGVAARHSLIASATQRIWNQPEHLLACYYQIRRAFHAIDRGIIGESGRIQELRARIWESVFTQDMMSYQQWMFDTVGRFPTLVIGPSGSGKELVARALGLARFLPYDKRSGTFAEGPETSFHPVNLSALSETLIESELFGHRRGAFTGAFNDRKGLFSTAGDYGTIFLDEIGEVRESTQVKLLRLLQSGEFQAIGENRPAFFKGKIIAATHKNLAREMKAGRFREDFYYRLCGDQVVTPALCEILADKPDELNHSIRYICSKLIGTEGAESIGERIIEQLQRQIPPNYPWPGNFRELEQAVRNCIVRGRYDPAEITEQPLSIQSAYEEATLSLEEWNRLYALQCVKKHGSYRAASVRLGVDQRTVKKLCTKNGTSVT